jgi:hypothetical protein
MKTRSQSNKINIQNGEEQKRQTYRHCTLYGELLLLLVCARGKVIYVESLSLHDHNQSAKLIFKTKKSRRSENNQTDIVPKVIIVLMCARGKVIYVEIISTRSNFAEKPIDMQKE